MTAVAHCEDEDEDQAPLTKGSIHMDERPACACNKVKREAHKNTERGRTCCKETSTELICF